MTEYRNLDETRAFASLKAARPFDIRAGLDGERIRTCTIAEAGSLSYNYAAMPVDRAIVDVLQECLSRSCSDHSTYLYWQRRYTANILFLRSASWQSMPDDFRR